MKFDLLHWASAYDFGISDNQYKPKYHTNQELYYLMGEMENKYPNIAAFQGGDDFVSMSIHSLKITDQVSILNIITFAISDFFFTNILD